MRSRSRSSAVGVCGSDVHYYQHGRIGDFVVEAPMVLGHESAGVVTAVGPGVDPGRVGQRVSVEPGVPDMSCEQCLAGRYNLCPDMRFFATPPIDGSLAEFVTVHEAFAHPVPDDMSDDAAALLEPLSVGVWANRRGGVTAGSRVLISGAGPVGLVAAQCALAFGATEVVVSDVNAHRLGLADELGATGTINVADTSIAASGSSRPCCWSARATRGATVDGIRALSRAGRAVLVGMGGDELPLPLATVQNREIEVTGTFRYANTWPTAIALVSVRPGRPRHARHRPLPVERLGGSARRGPAGPAVGEGRHRPAAVSPQNHRTFAAAGARIPATTPMTLLRGHHP